MFNNYWLLKHPMSRYVLGGAQPLLPLDKVGEPLKILLMASDTGEWINGGWHYRIPGVDLEIQDLAKELSNKLADHNIPVSVIKVLPTKEATIDKVREEMESGYHIIHYAGHGMYDSTDPDNSSLAFWESYEKGVSFLTAGELATLLRNKKTQFFYLNCCVGAKLSHPHTNLGNDYYGIGPWNCPGRDSRCFWVFLEHQRP